MPSTHHGHSATALPALHLHLARQQPGLMHRLRTEPRGLWACHLALRTEPRGLWACHLALVRPLVT